MREDRLWLLMVLTVYRSCLVTWKGNEICKQISVLIISKQQFVQASTFYWLTLKTFNTSFQNGKWDHCVISAVISRHDVQLEEEYMKNPQTFEDIVCVAKWSETLEQQSKDWLMMSVFWTVPEWGPTLCNTIWNMTLLLPVSIVFTMNLPTCFNVGMGVFLKR